MYGAFRKSPEHIRASRRLKSWTRERFTLTQDNTVMVTELRCSVPGCPPIETVVAFHANERWHSFKVFKPLVDVVEDDLPYYWLMDSLAESVGYGCDCC